MSSQSTRPSRKWEVKNQIMDMDLTHQVVGVVVLMVAIGQQVRTLVSSVAAQVIGPEIAHQWVEVEAVVHSHLHALGMVLQMAVEIAMLVIVIGMWMIGLTEVVMVIEIVTTAGMIDMGIVIESPVTGILKLGVFYRNIIDLSEKS